MTLGSRIDRLEQQARLGDDDVVAALHRGRDATRRGESVPLTPLAELEELAKRYPGSVWPRMLEARKRTGVGRREEGSDPGRGESRNA